MDRDHKVQNIVGACVFGGLALAALIGVIVAGATHHWGTVILGAGMSTALIAEIRHERRKH